jgi:cytochrome P450
LASNPADLKKLTQDPALMDSAIEEFLRAYAPVTMARLVTKDFNFFGHELKRDEWMLVPYPAANRDPELFEDAKNVHLDRKVNRHSAFGLGIHRCIGSNLARLELKVAITEFIKRFPKFQLLDPNGVEWSHGQIRGPRKLEILIQVD